MKTKSSLGPCHICGSDKYTKDLDGYLICEEGHRSLSYIQEEEEDFTELNVGRQIKLNSKTKSEIPKNYIFASEESHEVKLSKKKRFIFECCQLIFLVQLESLLRLIPYSPKELKESSKRFWILWVHLIEKEEITSEEAESVDDKEPFNKEMIKFSLKMNLIILYTACIYHAIPILMEDIIDLVNQSKIPYLAAFRYLPTWRVDLITHYRILSLFNAKLPSLQNLTQSFNSLVVHFQSNHFIRLPPLNVPFLAFRIVSRLKLPVHFFTLLLNVVGYLELSLEWNHPSSESENNPIHLLWACMFICLKLVYGFESEVFPYRKEYIDQFLPSFEEIKLRWTEDTHTRVQISKDCSKLDPSKMSELGLEELLTYCKSELIPSLSHKAKSDLTHFNSYSNSIMNLSTSTLTNRPETDVALLWKDIESGRCILSKSPRPYVIGYKRESKLPHHPSASYPIFSPNSNQVSRFSDDYHFAFNFIRQFSGASILLFRKIIYNIELQIESKTNESVLSTSTFVM